MKVSEYELKFGAKEKNVNVYIGFKDLKTGSYYVVYSVVGEELTGTLYYSLLHIDKTKLVAMPPKEGTSEIVKDVVWKIIHNESLDSYYEVLNISNTPKIEIIGSNNLKMKPEVITYLIDKTLPKPELPTNTEATSKKKSKFGLIIIIIVLVLFSGGYFFCKNIGKIIGYGTELICEREDQSSKLKANVNQTVTIDYDRQGTLDKLTDNIAYTFKNYTDYHEFREKGEYFKYQPADIKTGGIKWEDDNYTFRVIIKSSQDDQYFILDSKKPIEGLLDKDIEEFKKNNYTCYKQNREE